MDTPGSRPRSEAREPKPAEASKLSELTSYIDKHGAARAALCIAAEQSNFPLCLWLLLAGHVDDIERRNPKSGDTPLLAACAHARDARIVRLLLAFGADPTARSRSRLIVPSN